MPCCRSSVGLYPIERSVNVAGATPTPQTLALVVHVTVARAGGMDLETGLLALAEVIP